jgi:hypothetical protein
MSRALSLAGFQVTIIGRFWVTAEANVVSVQKKAREGVSVADLIPRQPDGHY